MNRVKSTRILIVSIVCMLLSLTVTQTLSQTKPERKTTRARHRQSLRKRPPKKQQASNIPSEWISARIQENQKRNAIIKAEFLREKAAIKPTPEQWKAVKPLLATISQLRNQPSSIAGLRLISSVGPQWQWNTSWEDIPYSEWTESQRIANALIARMGDQRTSESYFAHKIKTLRQCRQMEVATKQSERIDERIAKAQQKLRSLLTVRQEAALVLLRWL